MEQVKCKSCGASQEIDKDQDCGYCGTLMIFKESQEFYDEVTSGEFGNFLIMADTALEAEDYTEAINYYNKILEKDIKYADAWLGKANGMIYTSKIGDIRMKEALTYWKNSVKYSQNKDSMRLRVGTEINRVTNLFFPNILNHYIEFSGTDNAYGELAVRFITLESGIRYACEICPENVEFFKTGKALCELVISSPETHASGAQGAAIAEGLIGAFSGNKYSRERAFKDAGNSYQAAANQKKIIKEFSSKISILKEWYVSGLIRLGVEVEVEPQQAITKSGSSKKTNIDPSLIDVKEFKKLKKIYWGIIIFSGIYSFPIMFQGKEFIISGMLMFFTLFLILYFAWVNRRSKKRLGYPWGDVWKVKDQIGIDKKSSSPNKNNPTF
tara:strand:- start:1216 stop:2367 length:1152 start_codon:yes stop_codon:yes gene_type:complete